MEFSGVVGKEGALAGLSDTMATDGVRDEESLAPGAQSIQEGQHFTGAPFPS